MSCLRYLLAFPTLSMVAFCNLFFLKTCQNGVKQQHGSLPQKNGNSYTPNMCRIPILHYPTRWAPTIVINGVITPIKGLINGFHCGYNPYNSGVKFHPTEITGDFGAHLVETLKSPMKPMVSGATLKG